MVVHVLDQYYLAITILITTAYQLLGFFIAWTFQVGIGVTLLQRILNAGCCKFDKITDFTGGII